MQKVFLSSVMLIVFSTGTALGAGFKLPEQGAKAMGMSMAWTAQADNPSAIYYNPAGITQLEGKQILVGGTLIFANGSGFSGDVTSPWAVLGDPPLPTSESGKDQTFFAPVFYYTHQVNDRVFLGIGVNGPFGLARTYDPSGAVATNVQHAKLLTFVVNPTIAYKFNDNISVGAGINYMHGKAELDRVIPPHAPIPSPPAPVPFPGYPGTNFHLDGDGDAWAINAGVLVTPGHNLKLALSYKGGYSLDIDGTATSLTGSTGGRTKIELPDILNIGVAYQTEKFTVEFDYDYTFWSEYKNLDITLNSDVTGLGQTFIAQPKNWDDAAAYRLGFSYNFSDKCYGSLGLFIDETPVPDATLAAELPDADRKGFSVGTGFNWKSIDFDLSYIYFNYDDRSVTNSSFNGTWTNEAHLAALNLTYAF